MGEHRTGSAKVRSSSLLASNVIQLAFLGFFDRRLLTRVACFRLAFQPFLEALHQLGGLEVERRRQPQQRAQGGAVVATLAASNAVAAQVSQFGQLPGVWNDDPPQERPRVYEDSWTLLRVGPEDFFEDTTDPWTSENTEADVGADDD